MGKHYTTSTTTEDCPKETTTTKKYTTTTEDCPKETTSTKKCHHETTTKDYCHEHSTTTKKYTTTTEERRTTTQKHQGDNRKCANGQWKDGKGCCPRKVGDSKYFYYRD